MVADTRFIYSGRVPKENGRKLMFLETVDGIAILGYTGLGATVKGTEPADWMSAVLRGRNLPLEQSLVYSQKQCIRDSVALPIIGRGKDLQALSILLR